MALLLAFANAVIGLYIVGEPASFYIALSVVWAAIWFIGAGVWLAGQILRKRHKVCRGLPPAACASGVVVLVAMARLQAMHCLQKQVSNFCSQVKTRNLVRLPCRAIRAWCHGCLALLL